MTDEEALHAAVKDRPHDHTPRLVLADYYDDHGMPEHALAHRMLTEPEKYHSRKDVQEFLSSPSNASLDHQTTARVISEEADKITSLARTQTAVLMTAAHDREHIIRDQYLGQNSFNALSAADKNMNVSARGMHYGAASAHEAMANQHEAESYGDTPYHTRNVKAASLHRKGQDFHYTAGTVHDVADLISSEKSRADYLKRFTKE